MRWVIKTSISIFWSRWCYASFGFDEKLELGSKGKGEIDCLIMTRRATTNRCGRWLRWATILAGLASVARGVQDNFIIFLAPASCRRKYPDRVLLFFFVINLCQRRNCRISGIWFVIQTQSQPPIMQVPNILSLSLSLIYGQDVSVLFSVVLA